MRNHSPNVYALPDGARDDARQVYLRVTAALAVAALVLTQLPFDQLKALDTIPKLALVVGIAALVLAAVLHHAYLQRIHHTRREIAACLPEIRVYEASQLGSPRWDRFLRLLHAGDALMIIAAAGLTIALAALLF